MINIIRVIAGTAGGLKLKTLEGRATRPTSDKVKGSLFNILAPDIQGTTVLDLFSGTGALGIEALSRGAKRAVFIDNNPKCIEIIKENIKYTGFTEMSTIMPSDSTAAINKLSLNGGKFDIILIDPPYDSGIFIQVLKQLSKGDIIHCNSIIAVESDIKNGLPDLVDSLAVIKKRCYGGTMLTFYMKNRNNTEGNTES